MRLAFYALALCSIGHFIHILEERVNILNLSIARCPRATRPLCNAFFVSLQHITVSSVIPIALSVGQLVAKPRQIIARNALEQGRTGDVCFKSAVHVTIPRVDVLVKKHGVLPCFLVRNFIFWGIVEETVGATCCHEEGQCSQYSFKNYIFHIVKFLLVAYQKPKLSVAPNER